MRTSSSVNDITTILVNPIRIDSDIGSFTNHHIMFMFYIVFILLSTTIVSEQKKDVNDNKINEKHIRYVNLYFPINPKVQKMYEKGYKGGYKNKYKLSEYEKVYNFKYPFQLHVSLFLVFDKKIIFMLIPYDGYIHYYSDDMEKE